MGTIVRVKIQFVKPNAALNPMALKRSGEASRRSRACLRE